MASDYGDIRNREQTFEGKWKLQIPNVHDMAAAGFFLKGPGDNVECHFCGVNISDWKEADLPMERHREAEFTCPKLEGVVIPGESDDTVSEAPSRSTINLEETQSRVSDDSGYAARGPRRRGLGEARMEPNLSPRRRPPSHGPAIVKQECPPLTAPAILEEEEYTERLRTFQPIQWSRNFDASHQSRRQRRPPSPAPAIFKQCEERLRTFQRVQWPRNFEATPDKLAKAGFFYVGPADRVKCAYCGGKLKRWQPNDVAVEEHVKHFPDCTFVKNIEEQTAVLAKNIRSKKKTDNCVSSEELKMEYNRVPVSEKEEPPIHKLVCKVCKKRQVNTLFLMCRHIVTCEDCADLVKYCPECQQVILGTVPVFIS